VPGVRAAARCVCGGRVSLQSWLVLTGFFVFMAGLICAYVRITRAVSRGRDETLAALPRLTVVYRLPGGPDYTPQP
jgi:hypothetical protein